VGGQVGILFGCFEVFTGPVEVAHSGGGSVDIIFSDERGGQNWKSFLEAGYECGLDKSRFTGGKEHTLPEEA
jgi:hypothetical protein